MHFWRGFWVYAAISIAPPIVLTMLSMSSGAIAMLDAYVLAPVLIYAHPTLWYAASQGAAALWIALFVALLCCAVFGYLTRRRNRGEQWILAIAAFAGWWIVWRLIAFTSGVHPDLGVRM